MVCAKQIKCLGFCDIFQMFVREMICKSSWWSQPGERRQRDRCLLLPLVRRSPFHFHPDARSCCHCYIIKYVSIGPWRWTCCPLSNGRWSSWTSAGQTSASASPLSNVAWPSTETEWMMMMMTNILLKDIFLIEVRLVTWVASTLSSRSK